MKFIGLVLLIALCTVAVTAQCGGWGASCQSDCDCCSLSCGVIGCKAAQIFRPGQIKEYTCRGYKRCDCWPTNARVFV